MSRPRPLFPHPPRLLHARRLPRASLVLALLAIAATVGPLAGGCASTERYPLMMPAEAATDLLTHLEAVALARSYLVRRGGDSLQVTLPEGDILQVAVEGQDRQLVLAVSIKASGLSAEAARVRHEQLKALADKLLDAAKASAARGRAFE